MKTSLILPFACLLTMIAACTPKNQAPVQKTNDSTTVAKAPEYKKMIVAKVFVKPGKETVFIREARTMIDSTLKEAGCESYQLYQDPYDNSKFVFVEEYKNQAAVDAHFATEHFNGFGAKIGDLISGPPEIKIITVAAETKK